MALYSRKLIFNFFVSCFFLGIYFYFVSDENRNYCTWFVKKRRTALMSFKISVIQNTFPFFYTMIFRLPYQHIILTRKISLKRRFSSRIFIYLLSEGLNRTLYPLNSKIYLEHTSGGSVALTAWRWLVRFPIPVGVTGICHWHNPSSRTMEYFLWVKTAGT
jgi:hypothetical protein